MKKLLIFLFCLLTFFSFATKSTKVKKENKPVLQYDARYATYYLGKKAVMFFDTSEGILNTTLFSKSSLDTWRVYNINKISKTKGMVEIYAGQLFQNRKVHGRYQLSLTDLEGSKLVIIDTLTGRVWTCRQSNGVCDLWKVYDFRNE